ncbi:MAG: Tim44/TimA family putative adaptor protein [Neomegalonema sp.]|nr:Tim44/TimA family putative adaptor protein [Neomegalonema sp.]
MSDNDLLIIVILAAVAAFLLFRLRSVLGERSGFERSEDSALAGMKRERNPEAASPNGNVVPLKPDLQVEHEDIKAFTPLDTPLGASLISVKNGLRDFDMREFMSGASGAYEMLLMAFETGDLKTLRSYLSDEVYTAFAGAIEERDAQKLRIDIRFIGINSAVPVSARIDESERTAEISVKFVAEVVRAVRNEADEVVDGDPTAVTKVVDTWTFSKPLNARDPNWYLVGTDA